MESSNNLCLSKWIWGFLLEITVILYTRFVSYLSCHHNFCYFHPPYQARFSPLIIKINRVYCKTSKNRYTKIFLLMLRSFFQNTYININKWVPRFSAFRFLFIVFIYFLNRGSWLFRLVLGGPLEKLGSRIPILNFISLFFNAFVKFSAIQKSF